MVDPLPKRPRVAPDTADQSTSPVPAPQALPATPRAQYTRDEVAAWSPERLHAEIQLLDQRDRRLLHQRVAAMPLAGRQSLFLALLAGEGWDESDAADLPTIRRCCARMGISAATIYRWEDTCPAVAAALETHRQHARRWARDWMPSVIQGEVRASHEQTGLAIWTAGGGKTPTGGPATIRVVYEEGGKGKVGVEIQLPGTEG